jgi:Tol biopolymer transport system component
VKVLDFGLAKLIQLQDVPTTVPAAAAASHEGAILGTPAYMSPEQARGLSVDKRTDIWAFGCVVFEMLAGRQAFPGPTVSDCIAAVLEREPDWSALPNATPPAALGLLRRCLEKDPKRRLRDVGDAQRELDDALEQGNATAVSRTASSRLWIAAALVSLLTAITVSVIHFRETPARPQTLLYEISAPANESIVLFAISPDGRHLAFTTGRLGAPPSDNFNRLWVRPFDSLEAKPLRGTEGAWDLFWSADSRSIGFFAQGKLKRVDLLGGPPQIVCDAPRQSAGAWNQAGNILFTSARGALSKVSAADGEVHPATTLDAVRQEVTHRFPQFLPDGRRFLYTAFSSVAENSGVYAASLDSNETTRLLGSTGNVVYSEDASGQGYLLFLRGEALLAQRFDPTRLELRGEPFPVAEDVAARPLVAQGLLLGHFSSSASGILSYQRGRPSAKELVWLDRSGRRLSTVGEPADYSNITLSPDEHRVAVSRLDPRVGTRDVWIVDLSRSNVPKQLTFDRGDDTNPVWSPDGNRIAFSSRRSGPRNIYLKDANGTGDDQALFESDVDKPLADWSADGRYVLGGRAVLPVDGERRPVPLPPGTLSPRVSPDGRWLAYQSAESGALEIYVQSFPALLAGRSAGKWRVSAAGGIQPEWRRDGREIFYLTPNSTLMAVSVQVRGAAFEHGVPTPLFPLRLEAVDRRAHYQPTANGQRFLVVQPIEQASSNTITVVVNWTADLGR